uniref:HDC15077 n=3 Tax=Drosophila melanogaster TaxID=7227 RepID=Q6IJE8_DROME|nr:uncharacterized protein Dmel_CG43091 [Drosophila melanogaster]AFH06564.1 uncharacterized protein Dmel_CG43091 [Drosophila melanogaster]DAA04273.1 TPA_inf: HDC15077 [Drosophila melanogaster]|eukprot:NP_001247246.1 uncharacterized protein Dmel_CG43091 [Drosophila melanogaster]
MQQSFLVLLLGCVAFANAFGFSLRFLNPSTDPVQPAENPKLCTPMEEAAPSERVHSLISPSEIPSSTPNDPVVVNGRPVVPLPTLAPISTSTTTQLNRGTYEGNVPNLPVDCEPTTLDIGSRLSSQLLRILTVLG